MYQLAEKGEIEDFTGVSGPYEEPEDPELIIHTDKETSEESCEHILRYLENEGFLSREKNHNGNNVL